MLFGYLNLNIFCMIFESLKNVQQEVTQVKPRTFIDAMNIYVF